MIRITADMDNIPFSVAKSRTLAVIDYIYKYHKIIIDRKTVRRSSGGKGCHAILWTNDYLTNWDVFYIRFLLGDDIRRIKKDIKRRRPKQYLFKKKIKIR